MFDGPSILVAVASLLIGVGGTVLVFRSDLRNLTTRFEGNIQQQSLQRKSDRQIQNLQMSYLTERLEDIASALNVARRDSDVTKRFLALGAGTDENDTTETKI